MLKNFFKFVRRMLFALIILLGLIVILLITLINQGFDEAEQACNNYENCSSIMQTNP